MLVPISPSLVPYLSDSARRPRIPTQPNVIPYPVPHTLRLCRKASRVLSALLPVLLLSGGAAAQTPSNAPLTLEKALELAETLNPQLKAALAFTNTARAGITTAKAYPNPDFQLLYGRQYGKTSFDPPGPTGLLQHYSLSQQLELPGLRQSRVEVAQLGQSTAEVLAVEMRRLVRGAVKQAFYEVLRRRSEVQMTAENLRLIEDLHRRVKVQVEVGEAAKLELTRAEAEVATARSLARSSQLKYLNAIATLRAAINAPPGFPLDPQGALDPPATLPALDKLQEEVMARHPAIAAAQAEVKRAESRVRYERAQRAPQPTLKAEYENQPDLGFYRFGVSIPVPVWNRRQGPIAEAEGVLSQAHSAADIRRLEISGALERAYRMYEVASQQVTGFETGALQEAEAALRAAESAFKFGERGIMEVLDAQRVLRSVRTEYLSAQYDRQSALIELEQLRALDLSIPGGRP